MASGEKYRASGGGALHLLFSIMRGCTFWKVVKNRRVHFKWVAGVGERRLEFLGGCGMISQTRAQLMYIYVTKGRCLEFFGTVMIIQTRA